MQAANERRNQITEYISHNRFFTLQNLMDEFGISKRTAQRDIEFLMSEPYYIPIDSMQGNGGGYHVVDGWYASHKYFKPDEADLLHRLTEGLQPKDREIMERILRTFEMPKHSRNAEWKG